MTEQEVRETMKLQKWSFLRRPRNSRNYIYAARKVHGRRQEVYIGSLNRVSGKKRPCRSRLRYQR